jgi:hypothetical protein
MSLGFSVSCVSRDLPLLRGCLESIKHFAPDAPICLVTDGDFPLGAIKGEYDLIVLRRKDVKNKDLRELSYGYGFTKMVALWESPFKTVIHMDTDVVLWGDIRSNLPAENWDFVFNEPHQIITPEIQCSQYFDPEKIFNFIQPFPWQGNAYFNTGVFACRVGQLDLDEYIKMLRLHRKHPGVFPLVDQTMLNILVFRALRGGRINAIQTHLQTPVPVTSESELRRRFCFSSGLPQNTAPATSIHWAGTKPYACNPKLFSEPMEYFRLRSMRRCGLPRWVPKRAAFRADEFLSIGLPPHFDRLRKGLSRFEIVCPKGRCFVC